MMDGTLTMTPLLLQYLTGTQSLVGTLILALDVFAIVSVLLGHSSPSRKLLWIVVILLLPVVGMIAYYLFGRSYADA